jgi:hypothetical protein
LVAEIGKSGVCSHLETASLCERMGGERPLRSDSNG